ncbi:MAG TPA: hypothetical protein VFS89_03815 [Nitrosospira sp.]|nr:hypothetical protein [Nitrosospira sp.]
MDKKWRLPGWVRDLAMKLLPWAVMGSIGAAAGLYVDNIGNKRDIAHEGWRNNQQDVRLDRADNWRDRTDARLDREEEFHKEVIDRLQELLEREKRQHRRQREKRD